MTDPTRLQKAVQVLLETVVIFPGSIVMSDQMEFAAAVQQLRSALVAEQLPPISVFCPTCGQGRRVQHHGPYGYFVGCTRFPQCNYKKKGLELGLQMSDKTAMREIMMMIDTSNDPGNRPGDPGFLLDEEKQPRFDKTYQVGKKHEYPADIGFEDESDYDEMHPGHPSNYGDR